MLRAMFLPRALASHLFSRRYLHPRQSANATGAKRAKTASAERANAAGA